ncbi:hypothetical protein TVAG_024720 [Trichomonas vaginalis G3]|uniref:LysM domain-containing protein n=1 Tax=Trichomonas vaginalis (strain ATCC PRA-98 / G3) TaxID=412133 RepID=A2FF49_TRIV3|nr:LysM domain-containing protein [Trichomonas vaginalis G3]EAX96462.1 hypothetical protein TVAG_024720 [Trichomonas vaginalis G3]KAI5503325.1 LysM domain-containing protein [Trichomonas vaginalis G3]|eukprot:XP_001309392.1 hypothetical protein [Trichomonas vaginalis G3]
MLNWIIAAKFKKLPRPPHFDAPEQNSIPFDEKCGKKIPIDKPFGIDGIANMYHITVQDIQDANPGIGIRIPEGIVLKIPQLCIGEMDKEHRTYSGYFKSDSIARNGSLLLSFCYMSPWARTNAKNCEGFMKHGNGFDKDANLVDLKDAMDNAHLIRIKKRETLDTTQYELRKYNFNGKIHYAVRSSSGFYDPGYDVVTSDTRPYKSFYFEDYIDEDDEETEFLLD